MSPLDRMVHIMSSAVHAIIRRQYRILPYVRDSLFEGYGTEARIPAPRHHEVSKHRRAMGCVQTIHVESEPELAALEKAYRDRPARDRCLWRLGLLWLTRNGGLYQPGERAFGMPFDESTMNARYECIEWGKHRLDLTESILRPVIGKVGPHIHTIYSPAHDSMFDQKQGARETYIFPEESAIRQFRAGMTNPSATDHNQIAGALRMRDFLGKYGLAHRVIIGCESDTWFPDSGARLHLMSVGITEAIYNEIEYVRPNIHDLIEYLNSLHEQGVRYWPTHLLYDVNKKRFGEKCALTIADIDYLLERVNALEVLNGTRPKVPNHLAEQLAVKYRKSVVAAPDAHNWINIGNTWTAFPFAGEEPLHSDFVRALDARSTTAHGEYGGTPLLASNLLSFADGYLRARRSKTSSIEVPDLHVSLYNEDKQWKTVLWQHEVVPPVTEKPSYSEKALYRVIDLLRFRIDREGLEDDLKAKVARRLRLHVARRLLSHGHIKWREVREEWQVKGIKALLDGIPKDKHDWRKLRAKAEESTENLAIGEKSLFDVIERVLMDIMTSKQELKVLSRDQNKEHIMFDLIRMVIDKLIVMYMRDFAGRLQGALADGRIEPHEFEELFDYVTHVILQIMKSQILLFPYHASFKLMGHEIRLAQEVARTYGLDLHETTMNFTDTLLDTNGVTRSSREMMRQAIARNIPFITVTALTAAEKARAEEDEELQQWMEAGRLRIFDAIYNFTLTPEGAEDGCGNNETIRVRIISQLELLRFMEECYATRVIIQTPGPVGLQGLLAAKIRGTEISGIHHTEFADYAAERYGTWIRPMAIHLMRSFYDQVDTVISPTQPTTDKLIEEGCIKPGQRVLHLDRWVDIETFHPRHRSETFWEERGIKNSSKKVRFLYTGRVAPEKNLDVAINAFTQVADAVGRENVHFMLVGPVQDRRYIAKLKEIIQAYEDCITFLGAMHGEVLSKAYASCDVYVFPSKRDTFGKGPVEAQCSGLSVLVSDEGGPQTVVSQDRGKRTGYVLKADDVGAFAERMIELARNQELRAELSRNARRYAEERSAELDGKPYRAVLAPHELPDRYDVTGQAVAHTLPADMLAKGIAELAPEEAERLISELLMRIPGSDRKRIFA